MTTTLHNSKPDELDALLERLFDPGLNESETARIQTLLRGNPALQDRYADYVLLHAALSWRGGILGLFQDPLERSVIPQFDASVFNVFAR